MAQIGSYVPAKHARLGLHDAVLTRMGGKVPISPVSISGLFLIELISILLAYDEIAKGRSTFMVEISETSDILKTCTPKSLVILDEREFPLNSCHICYANSLF